MEQLNEIVREIEEEQALNRISGVSVFRSMLNQPEMIAVSSANAVGVSSGTSFNSFTVNMPRPVLETETLQLVNANIPQCVQNIPDTALVFWYYRLSSYKGLVPNPTNLYFVRLLPSYYKQEFISGSYGFNQTFNSYNDVATQLALSCATDLAYVNLQQKDVDEDSNTYILNFLPGEITIPLSTINKFQMVGTNATTEMAYKTYSAGTTYAVDEVVVSVSSTYISLQSANTGNTPATSPLFWKKIYVDIVADWDVTTPYRAGQYVAYLNVLYIATANVIGGANPTTNVSFTTTLPTDIFYRYLTAGFNDPNILINQGTGRLQWNPYALFEFGAVVEYNGLTWTAAEQNKGFVPFSGSSTSWSASVRYNVGSIVSNGGVVYIATAQSLNQTPSVFSTFWSPNTFWTLGGSAPIVGLNRISSEFDMLDTWNGIVQYPFPVGIPGQAFNPVPRRLLNSILGFTWNGLMNPEVLALVDTFVTAISTSTTTTELFNRVRPVPQYFVKYITTPANLRTSTAVTSQVYTADGYCNLVYSSIISIYTTIVGGSTVDTQKNTNLLAMGTMNCGNLGVSFFTPFINNPLSVLGDIYTISIQLQDEFGEAYVLTNNAVVTLVLKVTYKNRSAK